MGTREELTELGIEHCPECHCATGDDWQYADFSNKSIAVCPQCGERIELLGICNIEL